MGCDRPASTRNRRNNPANATTGGSTATTPRVTTHGTATANANAPVGEKLCKKG